MLAAHGGLWRAGRRWAVAVAAGGHLVDDERDGGAGDDEGDATTEQHGARAVEREGVEVVNGDGHRSEEHGG
eukprot:4367422-Prymnesium_polylepis.1